MDWHVIGLGISFMSGLGRYRFQYLPKPIASAGMATGAGLIIVSIFSSIRPGPAALGIAGLALFVGAIDWQWTSKPSYAPANPRGSPNSQESPAPPPIATKQPVEQGPPAKHNKATAEPSREQKPEPSPKAEPTPGVSEAETQRRTATLSQLTNLYILSHDGITPRMMAGMELPSADFLNAELERQGAKWRVRNVNGATAETYDAL